MREIINSGNSTVDAMAKINLTGNIIPANWFRTITRDNGKPYMLAICILSELCYWYRPQEVRDERSGNIVEYRKKFRGDMLQKNYQDLADRFGESKRSVKAATDRLEELGVIRKEWRNLKLRSGAVINNVLFIDLKVEVLSQLTFEYPASVEEISLDTAYLENSDDAEDEEDDERVVDEIDDMESVYDPIAEFCNNELFNENELLENEVYKQILQDKLSLNEGMLYENVIAQMLTANGHKLFFYTRYSEEKHRNDIEIDFLISNNSKLKYKSFPIEVRSGKRYTTKSLTKFKEAYGKRMGGAYIIHPKNLSIKDDVVCIPPYMTICLYNFIL